MTNTQSPAPGVAAEAIRVVEKMTCISVHRGNTVLGSFTGPECAQHAKLFADALQASAAGDAVVLQVRSLVETELWHNVSPAIYESTLREEGPDMVRKLYTAPPLPAQVQEAETRLIDALGELLSALTFSEIARCTQFDQQPKAAEKLITAQESARQLLGELESTARTPAPGMAGGVGALSVRYVKMPESCGRNNWTALLYNGDKSESFTLARSEYPHRVRYEADRVRHIIGELAERPHILDYDADERTPCHLCGGSGVKDGAPCPGLKFEGTAHDAAPHPAPAPQAAGARSQYPDVDGHNDDGAGEGQTVDPWDGVLPLHVAEVVVSNDDLDMGFSEAFIAGKIKLPNGTHKLYTDAVVRAAITASGRDAS